MMLIARRSSAKRRQPGSPRRRRREKFVRHKRQKRGEFAKKKRQKRGESAKPRRLRKGRSVNARSRSGLSGKRKRRKSSGGSGKQRRGFGSRSRRGSRRMPHLSCCGLCRMSSATVTTRAQETCGQQQRRQLLPLSPACNCLLPRKQQTRRVRESSRITPHQRNTRR